MLTMIFKVASRWKAILLIDEADIFMAQRSSEHLQLNALVSVFLRQLEQYDGILFLTTNRLQTFDGAILSRIHASLKYDELNKDARKAVWQFFIGRAMTTHGNPACSERALNELADKKMNGREVREVPSTLRINADYWHQIRNAVFVAHSMAQYERSVLKASHLKNAIASKAQFHEDFQGVGAAENTRAYF